MSSKFRKLKNPSTWRRLSLGTWKAPNDPTVYGKLSFDATKLLQHLEKMNLHSEAKITPTHYAAKAVAKVIGKHPDLNGIIKWNQIYVRDSVDIFLQVAIKGEKHDDKPDLSGAKIENCDKKTLEEIACELQGKCRLIRKKEDPQFKKTMNVSKLLPSWALRFFLKLSSFLIYNLGLHLPKLGLPHDPFGSAMVTSVGMWNIPPGYAPLVPFSKCPLIVCVGTIAKKPWVIDDKIEVRPILDCQFTFDHRFMDGLSGARMSHYLKELMENPGLMSHE